MRTIGRVTTAGEFTILDIPGGSRAYDLEVGPDGKIWFTQSGGTTLGQVTTEGVFSTVAVSGSSPSSITAGPDGAMWFTSNAEIGRLAMDGTITWFTISNPTLYSAFSIVGGADGNLWFRAQDNGGVGSQQDELGRITPSGQVVSISLGVDGFIEGLGAGPDGSMWFLVLSDTGAIFTSYVGKVTPTGNRTLYEVYGVAGYMNSVLSGPDGAVWFVAGNNRSLYRVTTDGAMTTFDGPDATDRSITRAVVASDGNIWFSDCGNNSATHGAMGRFTL